MLPSIPDIQKMGLDDLKNLWADITMPSRKSPLCYEAAKGKDAIAIKRAFKATVKRLEAWHNPQPTDTP